MNKLIAHKDDNHFVVNTYGLHNATLLRNVLPRTLVTPRPLYEDCKAHHFEHAATLRVTQAAKRAVTQAKRKATLAQKKAKQLETIAEEDEDDGDKDEDEAEADGWNGKDISHQLEQRGRKRARKG